MLQPLFSITSHKNSSSHTAIIYLWKPNAHDESEILPFSPAFLPTHLPFSTNSCKSKKGIQGSMGGHGFEYRLAF